MTTKLQDAFLNACRKDKIDVTVFLVNGVKLDGKITSFDHYCVLLSGRGKTQLLYKHGISTIMPSVAINLREDTDAA